jgi:hypothetical protein
MEIERLPYKQIFNDLIDRLATATAITIFSALPFLVAGRTRQIRSKKDRQVLGGPCCTCKSNQWIGMAWN